MKRLFVICSVVLTALCLIAGCPQPPLPEEPPSLAIMVESNVVSAGSSFMILGANLDPHQKVWAKFEWQESDSNAVVEAYCKPDEDGTIHAVIRVPEDIVPGDYEVVVYLGKHLDDRELIATLPIHVKAMEE